jgi:hypothetical protein
MLRNNLHFYSQVLSWKIGITVAYIGNCWSHRLFTTDTYNAFGNTGVNIHKRIHYYCGAIWWQNSNSIKSYPPLQVGTQELNVILRLHMTQEICLPVHDELTFAELLYATCITYKFCICKWNMQAPAKLHDIAWFFIPVLYWMLSPVWGVYNISVNCLASILLSALHYADIFLLFFDLRYELGLTLGPFEYLATISYCPLWFAHFIPTTFCQLAFRWLGVIIVTFLLWWLVYWPSTHKSEFVFSHHHKPQNKSPSVYWQPITWSWSRTTSEMCA